MERWRRVSTRRTVDVTRPLPRELWLNMRHVVHLDTRDVRTYGGPRFELADVVDSYLPTASEEFVSDALERWVPYVRETETGNEVAYVNMANMHMMVYERAEPETRSTVTLTPIGGISAGGRPTITVQAPIAKFLPGYVPPVVTIQPSVATQSGPDED